MTIREGTATGVLVLSGPIDVVKSGAPAKKLRAAITALLDRGIVDITLDMHGVPTLSAAGLGEIVLAFTTVRRRGGQLRLSRPSGRVRKLLGVSRVDTVIPVLSACEPPAVPDSVAPDPRGIETSTGLLEA